MILVIHLDIGPDTMGHMKLSIYNLLLAESRILILLMSLLLSSVACGQVIHDGDVDWEFNLQLDDGKPYIVATFFNMTESPLPILLPAGMRLNGQVEPCLPVLLGRDVNVSIPPGRARSVKVEALSLSFYSHTAGQYELAYPDQDNRYMCQRIQQIWRENRERKLRNSPFRLSQAVAYVGSQADKSKIRQSFTDDELNEAIRILKAR